MKPTRILSVLTVLSLLYANVFAQLSWTSETVVITPGVAQGSPALALGASGTAGLAYYTSDGFLNYAERSSGGAWTVTGGIVDRGNFNYIGLSLKLTAGGDPRIGFFSVAGSAFDARYGSRTSGTWSFEDIATTGAAGEYIHLGLASDGTARAAWGTSSNSLNYGTRASGLWVLDNNIATNGIPSFLRLNASNVPFIAMVDSQTSGDLRIYSNPTGSSWTFATAVTGFSGTSSTLSFRLNGSDAAVSWVDSGALMLARSTGGVWAAPETVVATGLSNSATSLAIDGAGNTYIAYQTTTGGINVASYNGSSWVSDTLYATGGSLGVAQGESLDIYGSTLGFTWVNSDGDIRYSYATVSAIPEPSTYAALAGLGALGLAIARRRLALPKPTA